MMFEMVKAWNYKWHLFEGLLTIEPASPAGPYWGAQPERMRAVTQCGEYVYVREHKELLPEEIFKEPRLRYNLIPLCSRCDSVLQYRIHHC